MRGFLVSAWILGVLGLSSTAMAQQVMVSPGSIIFEGRDRGGVVFVANTGDTIATYRIEPAHFVMKDDGGLVEVQGEQPPDSAVDMLRYSPRQFQLRPGESQTIRLAVRKPASLAPGEYRAHLKITNLGAVSEMPSVAESDGMSARIKLRVTRAIRVVVRHGIEAAETRLGGVTAKKAGAGQIELSFKLQKAGKSSSRGEYVLFARDRGSGTTTETFFHRGVIVYPEIATRNVTHAIPTASLNGALELCVGYRNTEGARKGKSETRCVDPGTL
jgi:P pilus assembly chaperone PapD